VEDLQREISQREIDPREKAKELYTAVSRSQYARIRCLFVYAAEAPSPSVSKTTLLGSL
jgi:hypothetical protein